MTRRKRDEKTEIDQQTTTQKTFLFSNLSPKIIFWKIYIFQRKLLCLVDHSNLNEHFTR